MLRLRRRASNPVGMVCRTASAFSSLCAYSSQSESQLPHACSKAVSSASCALFSIVSVSSTAAALIWRLVKRILRLPVAIAVIGAIAAK